MSRSLLMPSLRVLALLTLLAMLVVLALAPRPSADTSWQATEPGGPGCCGGGGPVA